MVDTNFFVIVDKKLLEENEKVRMNCSEYAKIDLE